MSYGFDPNSWTQSLFQLAAVNNEKARQDAAIAQAKREADLQQQRVDLSAFQDANTQARYNAEDVYRNKTLDALQAWRQQQSTQGAPLRQAQIDREKAQTGLYGAQAAKLHDQTDASNALNEFRDSLWHQRAGLAPPGENQDFVGPPASSAGPIMQGPPAPQAQAGTATPPTQAGANPGAYEAFIQTPYFENLDAGSKSQVLREYGQEKSKAQLEADRGIVAQHVQDAVATGALDEGSATNILGRVQTAQSPGELQQAWNDLGQHKASAVRKAASLEAYGHEIQQLQAEAAAAYPRLSQPERKELSAAFVAAQHTPPQSPQEVAAFTSHVNSILRQPSRSQPAPKMFIPGMGSVQDSTGLGKGGVIEQMTPQQQSELALVASRMAANDPRTKLAAAYQSAEERAPGNAAYAARVKADQEAVVHDIASKILTAKGWTHADGMPTSSGAVSGAQDTPMRLYKASELPNNLRQDAFEKASAAWKGEGSPAEKADKIKSILRTYRIDAAQLTPEEAAAIEGGK